MTSSEEQLWQYHLRAALGETLSAEEQAELDAWYAVRDQAEMALLNTNIVPASSDHLKAQIDALLAQMSAATFHIKRLSEENNQLRQEIMVLKRQLAQQKTWQPA